MPGEKRGVPPKYLEPERIDIVSERSLVIEKTSKNNKEGLRQAGERLAEFMRSMGETDHERNLTEENIRDIGDGGSDLAPASVRCLLERAKRKATDIAKKGKEQASLGEVVAVRKAVAEVEAMVSSLIDLDWLGEEEKRKAREEEKRLRDFKI